MEMEVEALLGPARDPLWVVVPVTLVYVAVLALGVAGNVCTVAVVYLQPRMRTATNLYLGSLALSDLALLTAGLPHELASVWRKWPARGGAAWCVARGLVAETCANASVSTITCFTVERYLAICHPFHARAMSRPRRATRHIALLWAGSLLLALPQALQFGVRDVAPGVPLCMQVTNIVRHSFEISTFVFFLAPMVVITVLYVLIGLRLREARRPPALPAPSAPSAPSAICPPPALQRTHSRSTRRVIKMLVAVVIAFFVCWAPHHAQRLLAVWGVGGGGARGAGAGGRASGAGAGAGAGDSGVRSAYTLLTYVSGVCYYVSTAINPLLYHLMSNNFRAAFKATLRVVCGGGSGAQGGGGGARRGLAVRRRRGRVCSWLGGRSPRPQARRVTSAPGATVTATAPASTPRPLLTDLSNSSLKEVQRQDIKDELDACLQSLRAHELHGRV